MNRIQFRRFFKSAGPTVLPVVHVLDAKQACRNADMAIAAGAQGVFLINHDFGCEKLVPILRSVRARFPALWIGVNFLAVTGRDAFPVLGRLQSEGVEIDAYWADDARIDERASIGAQSEAAEIAAVRMESGWTGLYFGGTAFKKQRFVEPSDYEVAAEIASAWMDAVTTSGIATGQAADRAKIAAFRRGCGDAPLALASGVTPENAADYAPHVDAMLVATGINREGDFYEIDPSRLQRLLAATRSASAWASLRDSAAEDAHGESVTRKPPETGDRSAAGEGASAPGERSYLSAMAPNVKGDRYAWLDPSTLYIRAATFHAVVDDLVAPL